MNSSDRQDLEISHVVSSISNEAAGPSHSVPGLCRGLAAAGHKVQLLSVSDSASRQENAYVDRRFRTTLSCLPLARRFGLSRDLKRAVELATYSANIIHLHGLWMYPNRFPHRARATAAICKVISPRGMLDPAALCFSRFKKRLAWLAFQRATMKATDLLHVTSEMELADVRAFGLQMPATIVPNGIDLPEIIESPRERSIVYIGRLHEKKGLENLIDAWARLEANFPEWRLDIYGPGQPDYVKALSDRIKSNRLKQVKLLGPVFGEEKTAAYSRGGFSILPSYGENFGMSVAESLAAGTPVIASTRMPWNGLITNRCGWVCEAEAGSVEAALNQALRTPTAERDAMGRRGRQWMAEEYSWNAIALRMAASYEWTLHGGTKPNFIDV